MTDERSKKEPGDDLIEDDYSLMILKNRLAKGEITLDEFDILKKKLIESYTVTKLKDEIKNVNEKMEKIYEERNISQIIQSSGKSENTTLMLSLVLGLIGFQGIGHMYMGKVGKGIGILILALVLFGVGIATVYYGIGVFLLIMYFIMFIWQIFDARKLCHEYNLSIYRSYSPKYSKSKTSDISDSSESQNIDTKLPTKVINKRRSWSAKKIVIVIVVIFLGISAAAVIMEFSIVRGLIVLPQPQQGQNSQDNSLSAYDTAYEKWRECTQKAKDLAFCGNPPTSPFDSNPPDCSSGSNDFRCNPFYTESHSGLKQGPP
jgi:hypothetical protein